MKKYSLEVMLAFQSIKESILNSISNAEINEEGELKFDLDLKLKPKQSKDVSKLLWASLSEQYKTLIASEMLAEGYLCIPIKGGWVVVSPSGEEYQLLSNECTCNGYIYGKEDGPCKHLILRDFTLLYRSRVQKEKSERELD